MQPKKQSLRSPPDALAALNTSTCAKVEIPGPVAEYLANPKEVEQELNKLRATLLKTYEVLSTMLKAKSGSIGHGLVITFDGRHDLHNTVENVEYVCAANVKLLRKPINLANHQSLEAFQSSPIRIGLDPSLQKHFEHYSHICNSLHNILKALTPSDVKQWSIYTASERRKNDVLAAQEQARKGGIKLKANVSSMFEQAGQTRHYKELADLVHLLNTGVSSAPAWMLDDAGRFDSLISVLEKIEPAKIDVNKSEVTNAIQAAYEARRNRLVGELNHYGNGRSLSDSQKILYAICILEGKLTSPQKRVDVDALVTTAEHAHTSIEISPRMDIGVVIDAVYEQLPEGYSHLDEVIKFEAVIRGEAKKGK